MGIYIPNALATLGENPFDCINNGNNALAQQRNSAAEQQTQQEQVGDADAQDVSPQFNGLTGNHLNLQDQQNGECIEFDEPPSDGPGGPS